MSHYEECDTPKNNIYGPFRKPRSTKRTFTRNCTIENPGTPNEIVYPRPPHTYAEILKKIITESNKQLNLADIYKLLAEKYPYFQHAPMDWRNSIRNCLSTNPVFKNINHYDTKGFRQRFWVLDESILQQPSNNTTSFMKSSANLLSNSHMNSFASLNNPYSLMEDIDGNMNSTSSSSNNVNLLASNLYHNHEQNRDILYNLDANINNLNDAIVCSKYMNIFCIEFFQGSCQLCNIIHSIGKKHCIRCECVSCLNDLPEPTKKLRLNKNNSFIDGNNGNLNISPISFGDNLNFEQNENKTIHKSPQISNNADFIEKTEDSHHNFSEGFSMGDNFSG